MVAASEIIHKVKRRRILNEREQALNYSKLVSDLTPFSKLDTTFPQSLERKGVHASPRVFLDVKTSSSSKQEVWCLFSLSCQEWCWFESAFLQSKPSEYFRWPRPNVRREWFALLYDFTTNRCWVRAACWHVFNWYCKPDESRTLAQLASYICYNKVQASAIPLFVLITGLTHAAALHMMDTLKWWSWVSTNMSYTFSTARITIFMRVPDCCVCFHQLIMCWIHGLTTRSTTQVIMVNILAWFWLYPYHSTSNLRWCTHMGCCD